VPITYEGERGKRFLLQRDGVLAEKKNHRPEVRRRCRGLKILRWKGREKELLSYREGKGPIPLKRGEYGGKGAPFEGNRYSVE